MSGQHFRIFATAVPHGVGPPRPVAVSAAPDLEPDLPIIDRALVLDAVARVLDSQPEPGESVQRGFDRKERELRAFFDQLDHDERATMYSRLTTAAADDPIVAKLARFSTERRHRLIASLSEAPRWRAR